MAVTLQFPYTLVQANGTKVPQLAPSVDSLPSNPTTTLNVVLTATVGAFAAGAYQWVQSKNRWVFVIDYNSISNQLFTISQAYLCFPNAGDNMLPVGDTGQAWVTYPRLQVQLQRFR
jgi:hypothetical protein